MHRGALLRPLGRPLGCAVLLCCCCCAPLEPNHPLQASLLFTQYTGVLVLLSCARASATLPALHGRPLLANPAASRPPTTTGRPADCIHPAGRDASRLGGTQDAMSRGGALKQLLGSLGIKAPWRVRRDGSPSPPGPPEGERVDGRAAAASRAAAAASPATAAAAAAAAAAVHGPRVQP